MIQCEELDNAQHVLDEIQQGMADLHDQACTQRDVDQVIVARYWNQISSWTDKYMRVFRDIRLSTTQQEWEERVSALHGLAEEGIGIKDDFRTWLVAALDEHIAAIEKRQAEEKAKHPVSYWILDHFFGPIFDGIDWLLTKYTKRGLYDRVIENQKMS